MGLKIKYDDNQTLLSDEEKEGLILKTVDVQKELDEFEQLNIEKAVEWIIHTNLKLERILTEKFVIDLHKKMFGDVWKWAGTFRKSEKNIGIQSKQIRIELKKLMDNTRYWITHQTFPPEEIAIRFKHRIVQIHCFPNGNGRHSRMMADIIMESIFKQEVFSWNESNMVEEDDTRKEYIKALKEADIGNFKPLIKFAQN